MPEIGDAVPITFLGMPLLLIRDRDARRCLAACIREGHRVLTASGRRPISPLGLPLGLVPGLMGMPNAVVLRVAKKLVDAP